MEPIVRLDDDQRAVQTQRQLTLVVHVRVIHERARARRREPDDERSLRLDERGQTPIDTAPPMDAVVHTVELHAVPVNSGALSEMIDDGDFDRLGLPPEQRRTRGGYPSG